MVDILLATYNAEKYLKEFLDSLLMQDCQDFRLIVGDDNSDDATLKILDDYSCRFSDRMIVHKFHFEHSSAKENFLRLLNYSDSEYVMLADQDDVWKPNKISFLVDYIKSKNNLLPQLIHTDLTVTDSCLNVMSDSMFRTQNLPDDWFLLNNLIVQNNVTGCTVIFNKALKKLVRYTDINNIVMHDWWFAIIAAAFGQISFVNESFVLYRQHNNNSVGAKDVKSVEYFNKRIHNRDNIKKNIRDTYIQAGEFLATYFDQLSEIQKEMLEIYKNFSSFSGLKKIKMLNKYMLWKNTSERRIGQIIWG